MYSVRKLYFDMFHLNFCILMFQLKFCILMFQLKFWKDKKSMPKMFSYTYKSWTLGKLGAKVRSFKG